MPRRFKIAYVSLVLCFARVRGEFADCAMAPLLHHVLSLPFILWLLLCSVIPRTYANTMIVIGQPNTMTAGDALIPPPVIQVVDSTGLVVTTINTGTVSVRIGQNPSLYGVLSGTTGLSFPISQGVATCTGLSVNLVGSGYTLVFVSIALGLQSESSPFDILLGPPYKLSMYTYIGMAQGGTPFLPQPVVSIVDRGGNIVNTVNSGTVSVAILNNPIGGILSPTTSYTVWLYQGLGKFFALQIDKAGGPYTLRFTADNVNTLPGGYTFDTFPFTVSIGPPNTMLITEYPGAAFGGAAFVVQPTITLIDAGLNVLATQPNMLVAATIYSNPSKGTLYPATETLANVINGVASFKNLRINAAGNNYELRFAIKTPNVLGVYVETGLFVIGPSFNVYIGPLFAIAIVQPPLSAIADGQPIYKQPILALQDRGANTITSESLALVTVSMLPSLALYNRVVVSTANPVAATVLDIAVASSVFTSPYGTGTDLVLLMTFSQDVIATGTVVIALNSNTGAKATCTTLLTWAKTISFTYGITAGDMATALNFVSTASLTLAGGTLNDRLGNPVSLVLPDPTANGLHPVVVVDTTAPSVASVTCGAPTVAGSYGAGQDLFVAVVFTAPVVVVGTPPAAVPIPFLSLNGVGLTARYVSGNGTTSLVFKYTVGLTDALTTTYLDVTASVNLNGATIKRAGTTPNQVAQVQMPANPLSALATLCPIQVDTTTVTVDAAVGVTTSSPNNVYYPGDTIYLFVPFTQTVVVTGIPLVFLNTVQNAIYVDGSGTKMIRFKYIVAPGDVTAALNYASATALVLNGGTIRRAVSAGTAIANVNPSFAAATAATKALSDQSTLQIDGTTSTIVSVSLAGTATWTRGNTVQLSVLFSSRVVVAGGPPTLALNTGQKATYTSGSGTTTLVFTYTVMLGDTTTQLAYNAIASLALNGGSIRKWSASPLLAADVSLPWPPNLLNGPVAIDPNVAYTTTVTAIASDMVAGEYGLNHVLQIFVTFSDVVQVIGGVQLSLQTQTIQYAMGSGTSKLVFMYVVKANDAAMSLTIASTAPFSCAAGSACSIVNANLVTANLDCTGLVLQPTGIAISTAAPVVVSVAALTAAPTINSNTFVVGDIIDIVVTASKAVHVDPSPDVFPDKVPLLFLDTGRSGAAAKFVRYGTDYTQLVFRYTVQAGDTSAGLTYLNVNALTLNYNQATIKRLSTNPTTDMNLLLPAVQPLGVGLKIDTSRTPSVTNVVATTPSGTYYCGDVITIQVTFSEYVAVTGQPVLILNCGVKDQRAVYKSGTASKVLTFTYTVGQDDTSSDLSYLDVKSLFVPTGASILYQSSVPTVNANTRLVTPGSPGSLSANSAIVIRGTTPYVVDIEFVTVNGTYTVNNVIQIAVTFTTKVTVTGSPTLQMGTGTVLRQATFVPTAQPSNVLTFQYTIQTGDASVDLDYASTAALQLNGGSILTTPTLAGITPIQSVNTQLNPPGGALTGQRIIQTSLGVVTYIDLGIDTMGLGYVFYFSTPPGVIASVKFDVTYSAVWEVRNAPLTVNNRGDRTGWSVDVNGAVAIVGSSGVKAKQYGVQEVTAWGTSAVYVDEVQYVETTCVNRDAVQILVSSVAPGATVGGYFSLMYGAVGPSRRLQPNFDAIELQVALYLDFGLDPSGVEVSRTGNTFCGCYNAYQWTITFHSQGDVPTLVARNYLTGNGATIGDGVGGASAIVVTEPPVVSGLFALRYGLLTTQNMASNVDAATMALRLATDLNLPIRSVARSEPTIQNGYTWSITFSSSSTIFNPNPLQPAPVLLSGNQVLLSVTTIRQGQAPLYGFFRLGLGVESTGNIAVSASAQDMATALQSLTQVTSVNVVRSPQNNFGGYTWTITFITVNTLSTYGMVSNSLGTLPQLTPITLVNNVQILLGSDAQILVDYAGVNPSVYSSAAPGNRPGESAGSATIFVPYNKQWVLSALLIGSDTHLGDGFGTSVAISLSGSQAVVGAPYAVFKGNVEQQGVACLADGGTFKLSFMGISSAPIPYNAPTASLQNAIAAMMRVAPQFITVVPYTTLCNGATVTITLQTPDLSDASGNIADLVPDGTALTFMGGPGTIGVQHLVQGTYREDGPNAKGIACGGVYFFASASVGTWTQVIKVVPTQGSESMSSEFGTSVSIEGTLAVVGAPGANNDQGEVYIYQYNAVTWSLYQKLTSVPYVATPGDRFGEAVKISGTTIIVGAPGYAGTAGAVFVFQPLGGVYVNRQKLQPGDVAMGDRFGSSLALDMQTSTIAIGTKGHNKRGAVYVYYTPDLFFQLQQTLVGSDTRLDDGFGQSVAIVNNVLLVGATQRYSSNNFLTIRKAIQTITTSATSPLGKTFRVGFRKVADGFEEDFVWTTPIPFDASATVIQVTLQSQLNTSGLVVSRLGPDANSGFVWSITFSGSTSDVPQMEVDGSQLSGTNAQITCSLDVPVPPILRSNVYVFLRTGSTWQEQATLRPTNKQYYSMFGTSVALSRNGYHAIVGAPNADTLFSAVNSGAAYLFDMGFLDFQFSSRTYNVLEGTTATIQILRCGSLGTSCIMKTTTTLEYIDYDTGDAVSDMAGMNHVPTKELKYIGPFQQLCMLDVTGTTPGAKYYPNVVGPEPYPYVPKGRYILTSMVGTANSRAEFYGDTEYRSLWIDSQFDYLGLSDYVPSDGELTFLPAVVSATFTVSTTDDDVYENPDETINLRLSVPGMWPSFPSQLWSVLTIKDDGDGGYGAASFTARLPCDSAPGSGIGSAVAYYDGLNLAAVGAPMASVGGIACGAVFIYVSRSGVFGLETKIIPPQCVVGMQFGVSVALDGSYGTMRLVVGAPGGTSPTAFVFQRNALLATWALETRFTEPNALTLTENYAGRGAVAIHGNLVVVGASGLEAIFVYTYTSTGWLPSITLRANDYAVDQIYLLGVVHVFHFGTSVAINRRCIVVGAPQANYGPQMVLDTNFLSTGAAYTYYLPAQVQVISLRSDSLLTTGEFTITNAAGTTSPLSYQISATDLAIALKSLISEIEVSRSGDIVNGFSWSITFISEVVATPLLQLSWRGRGCTICLAFNSGYAANPANQVSVIEFTPLGTWTFHQRLIASDANHADRFGQSVAFHGDTAIIGAYMSSALTTTTWDFETGDLTGWVKTGTAFDAQPTFGDNVMARGDVYHSFEMPKGTIGVEGRYWIGTYEARSGAGASQQSTSFTCKFANADCKTTQYQLPGPSIAGNVQGDGPVGTLTSQTFTILGKSIRFRIGGGCNIATVYVELLVDGISVMRQTGICDENMLPVSWNVTTYKGKSANIRIVDASTSALWGHINADDFKFDWPIEQASTDVAGVAYAFQRQGTVATYSPCSGMPKLQCAWVLQSRLVGSDKRPDDYFGFSVGIDDTTGVAVMSAYGQQGVDMNNSIVMDKMVGSVYLFSRISAVVDGGGNIVSSPKWLGKETAKFQSHDKSPGAQWGYAIGVSSKRLAVGSPGFGGSGSGYVYDLQFLQVQFASQLVGVVENAGQVIVVVLRTGDLTSPLTIGYATSDISAIGVDAGWFATCLGMTIQNRGPCGHYQQTSGELTFNTGESNKVITVPIMNNWCYDVYAKYIALHLNVLGGDVLLGEQYSMQIRIDDDDFGRDPC
ncbi:Aste57867_5074 [Aphanomyces stellatus]|uniref:Aste57867_5074 protein n=1 Tax=Aphanomyces stellatus TaxID=120398 RepID=A0A485KCD1_9STRA|nr:hypothetical protein As57867_005061 [Aphanomyces stellatus]VFT82155.1 Aste57867_5074 [Aphanomyces stellatus]